MKIKKSLLCLVGALATGHSALAVSNVVISQIYGGAGCGTAGCSTYGNDYIELYNRGTTPQSLSGWSVQYQSATGTGAIAAGGITALPAFTLQPGQYFLIAEGAGSAGTGLNAIPTADATGSISMSATAGKVALVNSTTALNPGTTCAYGASLVDLVGYGTTANCREGGSTTSSNAPAPSTTSAIFRQNNGCQDGDNNAADFFTAAPSPRNSSTISPCAASTPPSGSGTTAPQTACPGSTVVFTVTSVPGSNPTTPVTSVTADMQGIGLTAAEAFTEGPTNTWTYTLGSLPNVSPANYSFNVTLSDGSRTGNTSLSLTVTSCSPTLGTRFASPSGVCNGSSTTLSVVVNPGQNPTSVVPMTVTADLSNLGVANTAAPFTYTGSNNTYTLTTTVGAAATEGSHSIPVTATDDQSRTANGNITVVTEPNCGSSPAQVVISQIYGGGGNTGANYTNDFIELYNRGCTPVDLSGWSVQYASGTDSNGGFGSGQGTGQSGNVPTALSGILQPGHYYLIQEAAGAGGSAPLPTPDAIGTIPMSLSDGRVALVNGTTPLLVGCPTATMIDLVAYGTADCYEGNATVGAAATLDNTSSATRAKGGCQDTQFNRIDFEKGTVAPRNSASAVHFCSGKCCASGGACSLIEDGAACAGVYTACGTCTPNICPAGSGVCCRGATCNTTVPQASCTGNTLAGAFFAPASGACNSGGSTTTPCCFPDYNKIGGITVGDIFDFLNDWFAGSKFAILGGDGQTGTLAVQNIFDFLNAWFAGGC
jgi:hypothetical protein